MLLLPCGSSGWRIQIGIHQVGGKIEIIRERERERVGGGREGEGEREEAARQGMEYNKKQ